MKTIAPVSIWLNGKIYTATIFNLDCINDNMLNSAIFAYQLFDSNLLNLSDGQLTIVEPDYSIEWTSNAKGYNWAAKQLNLTITGDYITPVTK